MDWVALSSVAVVLVIAFMLSRPIRIAREPGREGFQDAAASQAYDRMSRWPAYALERHIMVRALSREKCEGTLLDVGCGPGHLTAQVARRFADLKCIGLDSNEAMLALARRNFRGEARLGFVRGDAERLPLTANSVNVVISSLSMHHWTSPSEALREILRVLAPGGRMVILDLRRDCPRWMYYGFVIGQWLFLPLAIRRTNGAVGSIWASYTADELETLLTEAGSPSGTVESRFGWLLACTVKTEF